MNSASLPLAVTIFSAIFLSILVIFTHAMSRRRASSALISRFEGYSQSSSDVASKQLIRENRILKLFTKIAPHWYQALVRRMILNSGGFEAQALASFAKFKVVSLFILFAILSLIVISPALVNPFLLGLLLLVITIGPEYILHTKGLRRAERIEREIPDVIDLMYLSISAGLSFTAALEKVVQYQKGAAVEELRRVLNEMNFGISRSAAFTSLASRTNQVQLREFAETIINVDLSGISLRKVFAEQSHILRERRMSRAKGKAQQIPVKILAPVILCFLPTMFIVVLGPAVISIATSFKL